MKTTNILFIALIGISFLL
ncbi:hypothetical protein DMN91_006858, partial [Ooceraea biroi]